MKKILFALFFLISLSAFSQNTKLTNNYYVNALDFGFVHDSSTDNLAAANRIIAYAKTVPYKRLQVYIPPGIYKFSGTIITTSDVSIQWYGGGSSGDSVISPSTTSQVYGITKLIINSTTADLFKDSSFGSFYTNMDLDNIASTNSTAGAAINSLGTLFHAQNLTIHRFFYGIEQQNTTDPVIDHIGFRDCVQYSYYSFNLWNSDVGDDAISNCFFRSYFTKTVAHIFKIGSGGMKIANCKFNSGGTYYTDGIKITGTSSTHSTTDLSVVNTSIENFTGSGINIVMTGGATFGNAAIIGGNISSYRSGTAITLSNTASTINHVAITGVPINNCSVGIVATSVDDLNISGGSNTSVTPTTLTSCTNVFYDRDVATGTTNGLAAKEIVTAFYTSSIPALSTVLVQDDFGRANTGDINGSTPSPTSISTWANIYSSSFVALGITSNTLYQPSTGTSGIATSAGVSNYDVSVVASTATITGGGDFSVFGNESNSNNYLFLQVNSAGALSLYQDVGGAFTAVYVGTISLAAGDTLHLRTYNGTAYAIKNSTVIGSGSYSIGSLVGTKCGVLMTGNTATRLSHFVVTAVTAPVLGWQASHDASLTGLGTVASPLAVNFGTSFIPTATTTYDLGSASFAWRDVYLSHPVGKSTIGASSGLGTNVTSVTPAGNDSYFSLTVVTSATATGTIGLVAFGRTWGATPKCVISAANAATGAMIASAGGYVGLNATSTSSMTLVGLFTGAGTWVFNCNCGQ